MFPSLVSESLNRIASQPLGRSLLDQIVAQAAKKEFGYTVCIMRPAGLSINVRDGNAPQWSGSSRAVRGNETRAKNGAGTISAVTWNANGLAVPGQGPRPPFIGLAHELIHALYNLLGQALPDDDQEELATVGLPPVAARRPITENGIRAEHGLPLRTAY